jgi:hypothetical protein
LRVTAKPDFDAIWVPRIGREAADELHRGRKVALIGVTMPVVAGLAGVLLGRSAPDDLLGVLLAAVVVGCIAAFISAQRRLATALSEWFGVKISAGQLPLMNPKRFDTWCERVQLDSQAEQADGTQGLEPLRLEYDHKWGPIRWSGSARRDPGK